jgi:hypothetical protein
MKKTLPIWLDQQGKFPKVAEALTNSTTGVAE